MSAVLGTFAVGWCDSLCRTLAFEGKPATGAKDDPFELLLHRATTLRAHPTACIVQCRADIQPLHPLARDVLHRLAEILLPPIAGATVLEADPNEFFARCLLEAHPGSMHECLDVPIELYGMSFDDTEVLRVPAYTADTPDAMRALVRRLP